MKRFELNIKSKVPGPYSTLGVAYVIEFHILSIITQNIHNQTKSFISPTSLNGIFTGFNLTPKIQISISRMLQSLMFIKYRVVYFLGYSNLSIC